MRREKTKNEHSNECHRIAKYTVVDLQFGFIGFLYFDLFGLAATAAAAVCSFRSVAVQSHTQAPQIHSANTKCITTINIHFTSTREMILSEDYSYFSCIHKSNVNEPNTHTHTEKILHKFKPILFVRKDTRSLLDFIVEENHSAKYSQRESNFHAELQQTALI